MTDPTIPAEHPSEPKQPGAEADWPSRRAGLRNDIARAIHRYDLDHLLSRNDIPSKHHRGEADAVLTLLYREWPWLQAEAEESSRAAPTACGHGPELDRLAAELVDYDERAAQQKQRADRAEEECRRYAEADSADAAAGSYAGSSEHAIAQPGRWLHIAFTSPDETSANTSALAIADHLHAEFDGVSMQITSNATEADTRPVHIGGQANAEDCPACTGNNPPYPFICPGPDAEQPTFVRSEPAQDAGPTVAECRAADRVWPLEKTGE